VGIDPSGESKEALLAAVELGTAAHATLRLLAAVNAGAADRFGWGYGQMNWAPTLRQTVQETLDEALAQIPDGLRPAAKLIEGDAVPALTEEGEKGVDLLVLGSRGYGPLRRVLLGSVSSALVKSAPCPVLVVPRGVHASDSAGEQSEVSEGAS